ncbi:MAG TPA: hypothetical protein VM847_14835, partial [Tahibacter sp.]|nr:hypothetical protein [Tahibacter sp.]
MNGVHVVVDASLSMCGYLRADESQRFRQLVNQLMQWSDKQRDHRVMLLHQTSADERLKRVEDIREAPDDFDAVLGNAFARHTGCSLFDGARSDVELAFAAAAAKDAPHSFVLISDLLLKDAAQRSFANAFRDWFGAQPPGSAVSAGIVTIALPFAGTYYS